MPFSNDMTELVGQECKVKPIYGHGWALYGHGEMVPLGTPASEMSAVVADVLFDSEEARVLICRVDVSILMYAFKWSAFLARSDFFVDLRKKPVHCNMIFSKQTPSISPGNPYPSPEFVTPNAQPHVRGFGIVSLAHR